MENEMKKVKIPVFFLSFICCLPRFLCRKKKEVRAY